MAAEVSANHQKPPKKYYSPCCIVYWPSPAKDLAAPSFSITVHSVKGG